MNLVAAALRGEGGDHPAAPPTSLHAVAPEVSISELVWSMDPDCRHANCGSASDVRRPSRTPLLG